MDKPRLAIECEIKNDYNEWVLGYTKYFDIEETKEIQKEIKLKRKATRIKRLYYANNYGIEIDWN